MDCSMLTFTRWHDTIQAIQWGSLRKLCVLPLLSHLRNHDLRPQHRLHQLLGRRFAFYRRQLRRVVLRAVPVVKEKGLKNINITSWFLKIIIGDNTAQLPLSPFLCFNPSLLVQMQRESSHEARQRQMDGHRGAGHVVLNARLVGKD